MATIERIVLECDLCRTSGDSVETHVLTIDGQTVEVEACSKCWTRADKVLVPFIAAGRRVGRKRKAA